MERRVVDAEQPLRGRARAPPGADEEQAEHPAAEPRHLARLQARHHERCQHVDEEEKEVLDACEGGEPGEYDERELRATMALLERDDGGVDASEHERIGDAVGGQV